jgi:hypothetical protein
MMKLRILKEEIENGSGKVEIRYTVQKKFLFWWVTAPILSMYNTDTNWNKKPTRIAFLIYRYYYSHSESGAKDLLTKLSNPFIEYYKNNKIIRVQEDNDSTKDVYINTSYGRDSGYSAGYGYEYAYSLDDLKREIDKRVITRTSTILKDDNV